LVGVAFCSILVPDVMGEEKESDEAVKIFGNKIDE
jgi:hypothetical protein